MRYHFFFKSFVLFFLLFVPDTGIAHAQKKHKSSTSRNIYLTLPSGRIETSIETRKKVKPYSGKIYYWFDNTAIHHTQGGYSKYLLHGSYLKYSFPSNCLAEKGAFRKGLKNGVWLTWNEHGILKERVKWRNGEIQGRKDIYATDGKLAYVQRYRHNKLLQTKVISDTTDKGRKNILNRTYTTSKKNINNLFRKKDKS